MYYDRRVTLENLPAGLAALIELTLAQSESSRLPEKTFKVGWTHGWGDASFGRCLISHGGFSTIAATTTDPYRSYYAKFDVYTALLAFLAACSSSRWEFGNEPCVLRSSQSFGSRSWNETPPDFRCQDWTQAIQKARKDIEQNTVIRCTYLNRKRRLKIIDK